MGRKADLLVILAKALTLQNLHSNQNKRRCKYLRRIELKWDWQSVEDLQEQVE